MRYPEKHYCWQWHLRSDPERLWPLVTNTNRFDRDSGVPRMDDPVFEGESARARIKTAMIGVPLEYIQEPFEWTYPARFGVARRYVKGPLAELRILGELFPEPGGGLCCNITSGFAPAT